MATKEVGKQSIGRVSVVSKGEYTEETQYLPLDIVSYHGGSYLAKQESVGIVPTLNKNDSYWQLLAIPGSGTPIIDQNNYLNWQGEGSISLDETINEYQVSSSGTEIPTGTWSTTIPSTTPGSYLWTRTTIKLNIGNIQTYTIAYQGQNGSGAVNTVNGIYPENGNITLDAEHISAFGNTTIETLFQNLNANLGYNSIAEIQSNETEGWFYIRYNSGLIIQGKKINSNYYSILKNNEPFQTSTHGNYFYVELMDENLPQFSSTIGKWPIEFSAQPFVMVTGGSGRTYSTPLYAQWDKKGLTCLCLGRATSGNLYPNVNCIAIGFRYPNQEVTTNG